jgi:hypothetical protein
MAVTEEYMVVNGRIYCKQKNLFEKKAGKLILAGNVKQPANANVIFTGGCLKTACENLVSTGGFLKHP